MNRDAFITKISAHLDSLNACFTDKAGLTMQVTQSTLAIIQTHGDGKIAAVTTYNEGLNGFVVEGMQDFDGNPAHVTSTVFEGWQRVLDAWCVDKD